MLISVLTCCVRMIFPYELLRFKSHQMIILILIIIIIVIYHPTFVTRGGETNTYTKTIKLNVLYSPYEWDNICHLIWLYFVNFLVLFVSLSNELKLECLKVFEHEDNVKQIETYNDYYYRTSSTINKMPTKRDTIKSTISNWEILRFRVVFSKVGSFHEIPKLLCIEHLVFRICSSHISLLNLIIYQIVK